MIRGRELFVCAAPPLLVGVNLALHFLGVGLS